MANFYFLFLVILQLIPGISSSSNGAIMTALPLMFVVSISMIKDAYEDYQRAKQDAAENNAECEAVPRGQK